MTSERMDFPVVIVGSGLAGIHAASTLAEHDIDVLLADENPHLGGQLLRRPDSRLLKDPVTEDDPLKRTGFRYIEQLKRRKITILNQATVTGIYPPDRLMLSIGDREVRMVSFRTLLFATGAREKFLPFKGWTLPGVYSSGMVQVLIKNNRILPDRSMVLAGSGLFLFSVAHAYLKAGGKLQGIFELTRMGNKLKLLPSLLHFPQKITEGTRYLSRIFWSRTSLRFRSIVLEARGKTELSEVVVGRLDSAGRLVPGTRRTIPTRTLTVGFGFTPNVEGPGAAGCELQYQPQLGGWVVPVDSDLQTSRPGIFAAGEITGVGGALKSIDEGKIAALGILRHLGKISDHRYGEKTAGLKKRRRQHLRFTRLFNGLYHPPKGVFDAIPEDTVICRCENVTLGELKKALGDHPLSPSELKIHTRCGMGSCQGRTCGPVIFDLWSSLSSRTEPEFRFWSVRPPLKPLQINALKNFKS